MKIYSFSESLNQYIYFLGIIIEFAVLMRPRILIDLNSCMKSLKQYGITIFDIFVVFLQERHV